MGMTATHIHTHTWAIATSSNYFSRQLTAKSWFTTSIFRGDLTCSCSFVAFFAKAKQQERRKIIILINNKWNKFFFCCVIMTVILSVVSLQPSQAKPRRERKKLQLFFLSISKHCCGVLSTAQQIKKSFLKLVDFCFRNVFFFWLFSLSVFE